VTPSLDIVIVNWNSRNLLRQCVRSLPAALAESFKLNRVVVVDNASRDGSADVLETDCVPIKVVLNIKNRGFAAACNQGASGSKADYLLFLNPDTRLNARSLEPALAFLEAPEQRNIGILGAQLLSEGGVVQRTCARAPTAGRLLARSLGLDKLLPRLFKPYFMLEWDHLDTRDVDQVMGAFLVIRRNLFEALSGFDEQFFVYYEDVDLCLRARGAGFRVVHFPHSTATHIGAGTTEQAKERRMFFLLRSRALFARKHFGPGAWVTVLVATLTLEPAIRLVRAALRRSPREIAETVGGLGMLWADLHARLRRRRTVRYTFGRSHKLLRSFQLEGRGACPARQKAYKIPSGRNLGNLSPGNGNAGRSIRRQSDLGPPRPSSATKQARDAGLNWLTMFDGRLVGVSRQLQRVAEPFAENGEGPVGSKEVGSKESEE
jgi:N-acetylglucosaminyl-diphospho-decaprenol L-rhamnosyltransferase